MAILCTYLTPPVITLGSPPGEAGLRDIGSGAPVAAVAIYLAMEKGLQGSMMQVPTAAGSAPVVVAEIAPEPVAGTMEKA